MPDSEPRSAVEEWTERVLSLRDAARGRGRVVLWEAVSGALSGATSGPVPGRVSGGSDAPGFVAAGAVSLPQDDVMGLEEFAYALRSLLQRTTGDPTVTVRLIEPGEDDAAGKTAAAEGAVAAFYESGETGTAGGDVAGDRR